ncbi:hypothetical protein JOQ06_027443 [Pogonophryne albipinna]|uniref:Uncharacterized protein n=1 Tax=Pogonophryne albipinna TaxID=1090488 RepID=A0AAD6FMV4_9TELE|nr:hypothetical protein JOQ06_027443 [Pogonophryne albipinna]
MCCIGCPRCLWSPHLLSSKDGKIKTSVNYDDNIRQANQVAGGQAEGPPKPPKKAEGSELPKQDKKEAVETVELSASAASEENIETQACTKKRKEKEKVSQAKRVAVSEEGEREEEMVEEVKEAEEEESEEELMEEDEEDEDEEEEDCAEDSQPLTVSQLKSPFFKVQQIKAFLKETKNKRGVKIEEFFTDKSLFLQSVKSSDASFY